MGSPSEFNMGVVCGISPLGEPASVGSVGALEEG